MGDAPVGARTRKTWTDEQKQAARERENQRRASAAEVRDEKQRRPGGGFGILPGPVIDDLSLSVHARFLLAMLSRYAGERSYCWPSIGTMARTLLCSERTVLRLLSELTAAGKIERRHRYLDGAQRSSIYVLRFRAWDDVVDDALYDEPPPDTDVTPGVTPVSPPGRHGCRTDKQQGGDQNCTEKIPPTPQKERAPRAAVGKEAGEGEEKARGPRPRMIALRDELVNRIRESKAAGTVNLVCPALEPVLTDHEYRTLIPATVDESTLRAALELLPPVVFADAGVSVSAALDYARGKRMELDSWHEALEADVERAYEAGTLRAEWREKLARMGA